MYAGAFGGPIAAFRDDRKVVLYVGSLTKPDIQLFTAAGTSLGRVLWDKGRIMGMGWSPEEHLVVVDDRGQARDYAHPPKLLRWAGLGWAGLRCAARCGPLGA